MKAIDTNILVRFLVNDDPVQAEQVRQLFAIGEQTGTLFFVPILVMLETIWVLESAYQVQRPDLIDALSDLLLMPIFQFEQRTAIQAALAIARTNHVDMSDILIAQTALNSGCESILTFDKKAARSDAFELLLAT
jgi:predicted nucleic-acid-binding protein